jgi:peptidoglycan L-alanyl-D-glutamate endopeptidase CwlK
MTRTDKCIEFFRKVSKLIVMASIHEIKLLPYSFIRSAEEQKKLFDEGKSQCDGINKISQHQRGLAIDLVIIRDNAAVWQSDPEYALLGRMWEEEGMTWGGGWTFQDYCHFEWKDEI